MSHYATVRHYNRVPLPIAKVWGGGYSTSLKSSRLSIIEKYVKHFFPLLALITDLLSERLADRLPAFHAHWLATHCEHNKSLLNFSGGPTVTQPGIKVLTDRDTETDTGIRL